LNFYCNKCKKNLCKEHYHNEVSCPFIKDDNNEENKKKIEFNYQIKKCDFCKGDIKNMEPIECPFCKGLFCLEHRLESDHKCKNKIKESISDKYAEIRQLAKRKIEEAKRKLKKK